MAVAEKILNKTFEENEELIFSLEPINKVSAFTFLFESGETGTFSSKQFRYTTDGLVFTEWATLSGILATPIVAKQVYKFELRYVASTVATLDMIELIYNQHSTLYPLSDIIPIPSVLSSIEEDDPNYVFWYNNVKDKMVKEGIIPNFIQRTTDYEDFWESNCKMFAILYAYLLKNLGNIGEDSELLSLYLRQRNLLLSGNESLSELQSLSSEFYKQISFRGTRNVFDEFSRISNKEIGDELILAFVQRWYSGWNINFTSPCSNYAGGIKGLNKIPRKERLGVPQDLNNYIFDPTNLAGISIITTNDFAYHKNTTVNSIQLDLSVVPLNGLIGISGNPTSPQWQDLRIELDERVAYEVFFRAKVSGTAASSTLPQLLFYLHGTDGSNNRVNFLSAIDGDPFGSNFGVYAGDDADTMNLFSSSQYNSDIFMEVRGIIYPKGTANIVDFNIQGLFYGDASNHLRFPTASTIRYVYPTIMFKQVAVSNSDYQVEIKDFRVQPLYLSHNQGGLFINSPQIIPYLYNNNNELEDEQIRIKADKFLLPANTINIYEFI